jgi:DNA-binding MarR family transcriptional regulator
MPCFLGRLLLASRAMARLYNDEMRHSSIEATQFSILQLLQHLGAMTQNQLGERMAANKATVSRNVGLLQRNGWVRFEAGEDRRSKVVSLTAKGKRQLEAARPHWERAQERLATALGEARFTALRDLLPEIAEAALRA